MAKAPFASAEGWLPAQLYWSKGTGCRVQSINAKQTQECLVTVPEQADKEGKTKTEIPCSTQIEATQSWEQVDNEWWMNMPTSHFCRFLAWRLSVNILISSMNNFLLCPWPHIWDISCHHSSVPKPIMNQKQTLTDEHILYCLFVEVIKKPLSLPVSHACRNSVIECFDLPACYVDILKQKVLPLSQNHISWQSAAWKTTKT